jgi:hypothetical protein
LQCLSLTKVWGLLINVHDKAGHFNRIRIAQVFVARPGTRWLLPASGSPCERTRLELHATSRWLSSAGLHIRALSHCTSHIASPLLPRSTPPSATNTVCAVWVAPSVCLLLVLVGTYLIQYHIRSPQVRPCRFQPCFLHHERLFLCLHTHLSQLHPAAHLQLWLARPLQQCLFSINSSTSARSRLAWTKTSVSSPLLVSEPSSPPTELHYGHVTTYSPREESPALSFYLWQCSS